MSTSMAEVVSERRWNELAALMDAAEAQGASAAMDYPWDMHVLAHIYHGQLAEAKAVWKRAPLIARKQSDLDAVHTLLQLCWSRQYSEVWTALAHGAQSWRPPLRPLAQALLERKRAELIGMLLSAYSTVKPSKVASMCGLSEADAISACQHHGWQLAADGGLLLSPRAFAAATCTPKMVHS